MSSAVSVAPAVLGRTEPRISTPPARELTAETSLGFEVVEFLTGVLRWELDPWQEWLYVHALELREDGRLRFDTLLILVARQNGKTKWLLGLVLWALFVDEARMVISSAQDLDKAEALLDEGYNEIENCAPLLDEVVQYIKTNGKRQIRFKGRRFWKAQAANRRGGRSISAKIAILDELREHSTWDAWNAIAPTTTAVRDGLVVAVSNAGDVKSVVLRTLLREAHRSIEAKRTVETTTFLAEWSAPQGVPLTDPEGLRSANPSMGYRELTLPKLLGTIRRMPEAGARTEHLCQWVDVVEPGFFPEDAVGLVANGDSRLADGARVSLALDVAWNRSRSHLVVAGPAAGGGWHVEVVASRAGTDWVKPWLTERAPDAETGELRTWWDGRLIVQAKGCPASSLIPDLVEAGVDVVEWGGSDLAGWTGRFYDALDRGDIHSPPQPLLMAALRGAKAKNLGDVALLDRKNSTGDASPALAAVGAFGDAETYVEPEPSIYETQDVLVI